MNHDEWLAKRRLGVSGTDISVLLGVNPYKTEDDLILDKLGLGKPFTGNAATRAGVRLEGHVANTWAKREQTIIINGEFTVSPHNPRFIGTLDFVTGKGGVLEIKTGGEKSYAKGHPPLYEAQCRWYMMLTERPFADLVACIVPKDRSEIPESDEFIFEWVSQRPHREYRFERDPDWEDRAQHLATQFLLRLDSLKERQPELGPTTLDSLRASFGCGS